MFSALARTAGSLIGRGLKSAGSSFTKQVVRQGTQQVLSSAERGITGFLNGQNRTEDNQQRGGGPVTSTLFNAVGLAALGPETLIALGLVLAIVITMLIMFLFVSQLDPWTSGLS